MKCTRILKHTDISYKIICAGSGFDVGLDKPVNVSFEGRRYQAKMHSKTKGRIDGLSQLYADFSFTEGQELALAYNAATNTIEISDPFRMPDDDDQMPYDDDQMPDDDDQMPDDDDWMPDDDDWMPDDDDQMPDDDGWMPDDDDWMDTDGGDAGMTGEKKYTQAEIYEIFSHMDPVVRHEEYYHSEWPLSVAVNHGWIVYGGRNWGDGYWLMNEDTLEKIPLNVSGKRYSEFLGANRAGLWFMNYNGTNWQGDAAPGSLIYTGPFFDGETVMHFNRKKAVITTLYIYELQAYYIACISENKQALMVIDGDRNERELFVAHKGETIDELCVDDNWIVFRLECSNSPEKNGWYVLRKGSSGSPTFLNRNRENGSPWRPAIEIHKIFLSQKMMWTEVTENEAAQYGIGSGCWIGRPLGEPKEGNFLTYKNTGKPVVWRGDISQGIMYYFDGKVAYSAPRYYILKRRKPDGSEITLCSSGHGECYKIVVSDKFLYGNFDATMPVRVPKLFSQPEGDLADNPEAEAIWGTKDIRF